ncbi:MAG: tetratricopeptide repeat protein, partial [Anaerolineales bacterium]|nr:tetratricopeptide repeat protein [Anaerolineales bacterium]
PDHQQATLDKLISLTDHSLIQPVPKENSEEPYFTFLGLVREFARAKLAPDVLASLRQRLLLYYASWDEKAWLAAGTAGAKLWLVRFQNDFPTIRFVLDTFTAQASADPDIVGNVARLLTQLTEWKASGQWRLMLQATEWVLAQPVALPDMLYWRVLYTAAGIALESGALEVAEAYIQKATPLAAKLPIKRAQIVTWHQQGILASIRGDHPESLRAFQQARALYEDPEFVIEKRSYYLAATLGLLGTACFFLGQLEQAERYQLESLKLEEANGDTAGMAGTYHNMARTYIGQGRLTQAQEALSHSVRLRLQLQDQSGLVRAFAVYAQLALANANYESFVLFTAALNRRRTEQGSVPAAHDIREEQQNLALCAEQLGQRQYQAIWREGSRLDQAALLERIFAAATHSDPD